MTLDLWLVGDGSRDHACLPLIVGTVLGCEPKVGHALAWKDLRPHGGGYRRKLKLALATAASRGVRAVVATVDQDRAPARERLGELVKGRAEARERPDLVAFPAAVGEARPHGEAWLLDDPVAVRDGLYLPGQVQVPAVSKVKDPKSALADLDALVDHPPGEAPIDRLARIARALDPTRCRHAKDTGFADFVADLRSELGRLLP